MIKIIIYGLGLLLSTVIYADETTQTPPKSEVKIKRIEAKRGSVITLQDLSQIADITSARNEAGKPAKLEEESYTIGAYSSSTISVAPVGNKKADSLITLDLNKKPVNPVN